jgi:hypothetical protein
VPAGEDAAAAAGKVANGIVNGAYEATRFKSKPNLSLLEKGGSPNGTLLSCV